MVLFIPGYVLISALFPKKNDLDAIERIALSFGLSIAVVPLIGLGLNYTPFGIRLVPIIVTLSIYTVLLIIVGIYRREELPEDEKFKVPIIKFYHDIIGEVKKPKTKVDNILTIVLIFSIILAIGMVIYVIVTPKVGEKFTEFYILNSTTGKADNYPTNLKYDMPSNIKIGIINHEHSIVNYTIQTILDKKILTTAELTLGNNQTWEKNITFVPDKEGKDMRLEFLLFKGNNFTNPYRELHLWINVCNAWKKSMIEVC